MTTESTETLKILRDIQYSEIAGEKAYGNLFLYEGSKERGHNIWRNGKAEPDLHEKLENQIIAFLSSFYAKK
ncbi:hypothetical protein [Puniceicoccus vermicola]|uniref:Uncharacterized protein n=1 Tax=Puniceicoccus vermicola TaxID=388746 RepID=A0A7X1B187_9BACT|nr:hypothetical protein [Puniceicoccus vermicola]MBC2602668.1 hypothetical protein [Puniceicoccus vermicola]